MFLTKQKDISSPVKVSPMQPFQSPVHSPVHSQPDQCFASEILQLGQIKAGKNHPPVSEMENTELLLMWLQTPEGCRKNQVPPLTSAFGCWIKSQWTEFRDDHCLLTNLLTVCLESVGPRQGRRCRGEEDPCLGWQTFHPLFISDSRTMTFTNLVL
jgi:hypothetical protein